MTPFEFAMREVGTVSPSNMDNKYNRAFYGGRVNNPALHWCVVFCWWCYQQAGVEFCGGVNTASCEYVMNWAQRNKKWVRKYGPFQRGDMVLFDWNKDGIPDHIGFVDYIDATGIHTIEGNTTSPGHASSVARKSRRDFDIMGAYREPAVSKVLTEPAPWAREACQWAVDNGIFKGTGDGFDWARPLTRQELAVILHRMKG